MDYKARAKNRKLKRKLQKFVSAVKFNSVNWTVHHKLILVGCLIVIASLFFNWLQIDSRDPENGFSSLIWVSGYVLFTISVFVIFVIMSQRKKEHVKRFFNISFKDYHPPIVGWCIALLLIINSLISMRSLNKFSSQIEYGNGVFIAISGSVFIIVGGFLLKKYYDKNIKGIYSDANESEWVTDETRNNMKLPF